MPRRLKVNTIEMGYIDLYLIYDEGGVWEEYWRPLQDFKPVVSLLPSVTAKEMEAVLVGYSKVLVRDLIAPKGMLVKLPVEFRQCWSKLNCPFFIKKNCALLSKNLPWCFTPDGIPDKETDIRRLTAEIIQLWREEVYVVLVREPKNE